MKQKLIFLVFLFVGVLGCSTTGNSNKKVSADFEMGVTGPVAKCVKHTFTEVYHWRNTTLAKATFLSEKPISECGCDANSTELVLFEVTQGKFNGPKSKVLNTSNFVVPKDPSETRTITLSNKSRINANDGMVTFKMKCLSRR